MAFGGHGPFHRSESERSGRASPFLRIKKRMLVLAGASALVSAAVALVLARENTQSYCCCC